MTRRERFEAWAVARGMDIRRYASGTYVDHVTRVAWAAVEAVQ